MTKLKTFIILGALVLIPLGTITVLANSNEYCNNADYNNANSNNTRMHRNRRDRYSDTRANDNNIYNCANTDYNHVHGEYCNEDNYGRHMNSNRQNSSRRQGRNCH